MTAYWPFRGVWRRLLEFWDVVARQVLAHAIAPPDAVDLSGEDLSRIKAERDLNPLARPHVFEVLLVEGREHVTVCLRDQGGNSADANGCRTPCPGALED